MFIHIFFLTVCLSLYVPAHHIMQQEEVIDSSEGRIGLLGDWREVLTRVQWLLSLSVLFVVGPPSSTLLY